MNELADFVLNAIRKARELLNGWPSDGPDDRRRVDRLQTILNDGEVSLAGTSAFMGGDPTTSIIGMVGIGIVYIATIVISVMFAKRRLNDLNRSGWWFLLFIIPFVNLLLAIYLIFFPGTSGDNNFGAAPAANSIGVLILGWLMPVLFILGIVAAIAIPAYQDYLSRVQ